MLRAPLALLLLLPQDLSKVEEFGLRVAKGFKVTLVSDHALANDLYSMTLDSKGRIVVSSAGWIKTLHDDDGDGKADRAELFAEVKSGAMGMCFDGNDLLASAGGGLWRYRDADGDGKADGPPELISKYVFGEHGHHAIRKGPDGWWYLIGGNDAAITKEHVTLPNSPIREPEAGAIVRYTPDFSKSEVVAHGFRNPYDFDFNEHGDLFTYDSDCERDYLLPWYTPTRLYHVAIGMHHGWRLKGYLRSFARRDDFIDSVPMLVPVGRGSPTGVVCYRHDQFPERYRGGVFYADWTFGRIFFTPLVPEGASYKSQVEVFLEPSGTEGFAPNDLCVAPDGSLLVSIGGRRTRGAVYRVEWAGAPVPRRGPPKDDLDAVLSAPQPLDAWSRTRWEPLARKLGAGPFHDAATSHARAVEVLVDLFKRATRVAPEAPTPIRARAAWSHVAGSGGTHHDSPAKSIVDPDPRVRRAALDAFIQDPALWSLEPQPEPAILSDPDRRVRQAAALVAARAPKRPSAGDAQGRLTLALSDLRRGERPVGPLLENLGSCTTPELRLEAVRLLIAALGDANLEKPPVELHSNYNLADATPDRDRILKAVRPLLPSGHEHLDLEASRLLAMLEDEAPETVTKAVAFLTEKSSATADLHYLIVLSRLKGAWPDGLAARAAGAMLSLGKKLEGQEQRGKMVWGQRLGELTALFSGREGFADAVVRHPAFVSPGHVEVAAALPADVKREAARRFLDASANPGFGWSQPLVELLSTLPPGEFHAALRGQWSNFGLRDTIVLRLAAAPEAQDREKFMAGVEAASPQVVDASLGALEKLPRDETAANLVPLLKVLRRLLLEPTQNARRGRITALLARQSGRAFEIKESGTTPIALKAAYAPVFDAFPPLDEGENPAALLAGVPWDQGDATRGAEVFRARGCQTCHAVQGALGPTLAGAAKRFSREDLFEAIANPSKDVAPLYRTTMFLTRDGQVFTGIVAFESADGYIVQTGATTTVRINTPDIAGIRPGTLSLMPNDLLKGLKPIDLADLYAYLRSLP
jgi:putative membrane-bound dehydrogenase-like protein